MVRDARKRALLTMRVLRSPQQDEAISSEEHGWEASAAQRASPRKRSFL